LFPCISLFKIRRQNSITVETSFSLAPFTFQNRFREYSTFAPLIVSCFWKNTNGESSESEIYGIIFSTFMNKIILPVNTSRG
jgi:hypothetical protein